MYEFLVQPEPPRMFRHMKRSAFILTDWTDELGQLVKEFVKIVIGHPAALVALVLSSLCGYGISFILFDYRRTKVKRSHILFHAGIGLGYSAVIFLIVNFDLISRNLTAEDIMRRIPLTLLISFVVAFVIMLVGGLWREFAKPYAAGEVNGDDN